MKHALVFAAVADDDTGASDLAGMLADQGVAALLVLDPSFLDEPSPQLESSQAIIFATATRALPKEQAYAITKDSVTRAAALGVRSVQIKYCSTFDSTAEGNIGPSVNAALDVLGESFTIAVPALPVNGRTTYLGHHFVNGRLLSESPMRHHPLTPMTNSNLVEHLQRQTGRRVGLTPYHVVAAGAESIRRQWDSLRSEGVAVSVVDCLDAAHAAAIAGAACDMKLISGSSLLGAYLPAEWRQRGWIGPPAATLWGGLPCARGRGRLVVAGSCSVATAGQNAWLARQGGLVVEVEARELLGANPPDLAGPVAAELARGGTVLLKTRSSLTDVEETQRWGAKQGWTTAALGLRIAAALAAQVHAVLSDQIPEALVCAGGETSGAICRKLGIRSFAVDRNIQPGAPLCLPLQGPCVPMALKSGNFGSEDFYGAAFRAAALRATTFTR